MEIPLSLEVIVTIALFAIAAVGSVIGYFLSDIRNELKGLRGDISATRSKQNEIDKRLGMLETRVNICKTCPNEQD